MKTTIRIEKEVDIKFVKINISPRYIGDDEDDDLPTDFPLLVDKKQWIAVVDIDTGKIQGWPKGEVRLMFVKVCDAGVYTLFDENMIFVDEVDGYVPNGLIPGDYGDYVNLVIDGDGVIKNWPKQPSLEEFFQD